MDRPRETIELPSGTKVEMYTYRTVGERREILKAMGDIKLSGQEVEMTPYQAEMLQSELVKKLVISDVDLDNMPIKEGDYIAGRAMKRFNSDPNALSGSGEKSTTDA
jgi:hypothetical protein